MLFLVAVLLSMFIMFIGYEMFSPPVVLASR